MWCSICFFSIFVGKKLYRSENLGNLSVIHMHYVGDFDLFHAMFHVEIIIYLN